VRAKSLIAYPPFLKVILVNAVGVTVHFADCSIAPFHLDRPNVPTQVRRTPFLQLSGGPEEPRGNRATFEALANCGQFPSACDVSEVQMQFNDRPGSDHHVRNCETDIEELRIRLRSSIENVDDPRAQALLETAAEVLTGLSTAMRHYREGEETAFRS
jgi:hypothetical protein